MKCASKAHANENCMIVKSSEKETNVSEDDRLHAMIMAMEEQEGHSSEMNPDSEYLCAVQDRNRRDLILMMYNCEVNRLKGTALGDPGATITYISSDYAKKANVRFHEKSKPRAVQLPNGNEMKILGYCKFLMRMGE